MGNIQEIFRIKPKSHIPLINIEINGKILDFYDKKKTTLTKTKPIDQITI